MAGLGNRSIKRLSATLVAGLLLLPTLNACKPGTPTSLTGIVQDMAGLAGSDQLARLNVELIPEKGLSINAAFLKEDGTAVEFSKHPSDNLPLSLGSPPLKIPMSGLPLGDIDLDEVEQRLDEVPDCERARADVLVFGEHVAKNFHCGIGSPVTAQLDDADVTPISAGDFAAAADQLRQDLTLLGTTELASAAVGMTREEVWTQLHAVEPRLQASDGGACPLFMIRAKGAFVVRCESTGAQVTADSIDPAAMTKIWKAEGQPSSGWLLELVVDEDQAHWRASKDHLARSYTLKGEPRKQESFRLLRSLDDKLDLSPIILTVVHMLAHQTKDALDVTNLGASEL